LTHNGLVNDGGGYMVIGGYD